MSKKRLNLLLVVLALIGCVLFVWIDWADVAPSDADSISEAQAIANAESFWERQHVPVKTDQVSAIQDSNVEADGYLTKNNLHHLYDQKAPQQAPLEYWTVTFSNPNRGDSYMAQVDLTRGTVVGFSQSGHLYDLTAGSKRTSQLEQALYAVGLDPAQLGHPKRTGVDTNGIIYSLAVPQWEVGGMGLHYEVALLGGQVSSLRAVYDLPSTFTNWRQRQLTIGSLLTLLSLLGTIVMFVFAFAWLIVLKTPKRKKVAVWLSVAIFLFSLVSNINQLGTLDQAPVSTTPNGNLVHSISLVVEVLLLAGTSLLTALSTYPAIATGGVLVEQLKPRLWTKWRDPEWGKNLRQAVWRGYLLAVAWLGFQQVFYWVAQTYFGVWTENDPSLTPSNFLVPALFPVMAWMAGFQEELFYRMFGVTFCKRYLKNTFLAVLLPAMVWALGHSLYPVYPTYTRFIELSIFGSIIGLCYLKFGIETVIVAHLVFDSVQMCLGLMSTGEHSLVLSGTIFLLLPLVGGFGISYLKPRKRLPEDLQGI